MTTKAISALQNEFTGKNGEVGVWFREVILAMAEVEVLSIRAQDFIKSGNLNKAQQCNDKAWEIEQSPEIKWFRKDHLAAYIEIQQVAGDVFKKTWDWAKTKEAVKALAA